MMLDASFKHIEGAFNIHMKSAAGIVITVQKPECRQMKDDVLPLDGFIQDIRLHNIAAEFEHLDPRIFKGLDDIIRGAPDEIVIDDDFFDILFPEFVNDVRANKTRPSDD